MRPFVLSLCFVPLLAGCALNVPAPGTISANVAQQNGASIRGNIQGGHQAIAGSHVHLLAAGTTGYGAASTSLLTSGTAGSDSIGGYVTTASDGSYSIDGDYSCTPGQHLYLFATGGSSQGPSNTSVGLMTALDVCPSSGSLSAMNATLNEVSTVAAAFALAPFATNATHISAPGTAAAHVGVENAFANIANLVDRASGAALAATPAGNGIAPQAAVNTLANILAACIDTNGTTPPTCSILFANATADGTPSGALPTDTATAAINIAHHPASNVAALFALVTNASPFSGGLSTQPSDLTLTMQFTTNTPGATTLAIDAAGDLWFPSTNGLSALSPTGATLPNTPFAVSGIQNVQAIAIDPSDNIWLANSLDNTYTKLSATASLLGSATVPGFNNPTSIVIDPSGDLWFANYAGSSLSKLSSSGSLLSTVTGGGLDLPFQTLSDASGNLWSPDPNHGAIVKTDNSGAPKLSATFTAPGLSPAFGPQMAVLDSHQNVWVMNQDASISGISNSGAPLSGTPFHTGSGASSLALAVDGLNNLWALADVYNSQHPLTPHAYTLLGYNASGASLLGSAHTFPDHVSSLAVDNSGNLWIASETTNTIQEIVGLTAPVVTPISVGVAHNTIATRP